MYRQYLQTHGFNVKHTTVQNGSLCTETLLSQTVRKNQKDLLLYLLDHGADVNYMYVKQECLVCVFRSSFIYIHIL